MEKAQRDKLILCILGILLCFAISYWGVPPLGLPPLGTVQAVVAKLKGERTTLDEQVKRAKAQVDALKDIKKEREVLEVQLKELSRRLPSERETPQLLRKVEELSLKSGLQLAEVKRRPLRVQELYVEIPMEVAVGGGYRDLLKLAEELGNLDRLVTLSEVVVARPAAPGGQPAPPGVAARLVAIVFQTLPEATPAAKTTQ
jgi:type IV pilus assembly protein PilO